MTTIVSEKGQITMDVNQCPTLEADVVFQMMEARFAGKPYKKAVFPNFLPFEKDTISREKLIPWILEDYMAKREAKAFIYDINDAVQLGVELANWQTLYVDKADGDAIRVETALYYRF